MPDDIDSILGVSSGPSAQNSSVRALPGYYLWIEGKQDGPFEPAAIRQMLGSGQIADATLAYPENGGSGWRPIKDYPQIFVPPKPSAAGLPAAATAPKAALSPMKGSLVVSVFRIIAVLEFILSPLAGLGVGANDAEAGWLLFFSGIISGLFLLGFSQIIQNTLDSSQRLGRIEMLLARKFENKDVA